MAVHLHLNEEERDMAPFTATAAATMMQSMAALAAIAGFAFTSVEGADMRTAYEDQSLS